MFILQTGDGQGQKLHRFGLEEANGKADRIGFIALTVQIKPFLIIDALIPKKNF